MNFEIFGLNDAQPIIRGANGQIATFEGKCRDIDFLHIFKDTLRLNFLPIWTQGTKRSAMIWDLHFYNRSYRNILLNHQIFENWSLYRVVHLYASFGTFCVRIGQSFETQ